MNYNRGGCHWLALFQSNKTYDGRISIGISQYGVVACFYAVCVCMRKAITFQRHCLFRILILFINRDYILSVLHTFRVSNRLNRLKRIYFRK